MSVITHFTLRPFNLSYIDVLKIHIKEDTLLIHFPARAHSAITYFPPPLRRFTAPHLPPRRTPSPKTRSLPHRCPPPTSSSKTPSPAHRPNALRPHRRPSVRRQNARHVNPSPSATPHPIIKKSLPHCRPPHTSLRIRGTSTHHPPLCRTPS